jgi:membrane protease YdiL (CAAX protease family)
MDRAAAREPHRSRARAGARVSQAPRPFPTPASAVLLTMMGVFFTTAIAIMVSGWATPTAAMGIGTAFGLGGAGMLGAVNVPPPHAERVGLRAPSRRQLLGLLLLLPIAILASEVDNEVVALFPAARAQEVVQEATGKFPFDASLATLETVIVGVGLIPVVEEWFFRGVIQQGLVASLGAPIGIFGTALIFALGHGAGLSPEAWGALVAQTLVLGLALGYARYRTGSLVAPILLHVGVNGIGVAAMAGPDVIAVPGYNAPGAHTPLAILLPSIVSVAAGLWWLSKEPVPPIPTVPMLDESDPYEE